MNNNDFNVLDMLDETEENESAELFAQPKQEEKKEEPKTEKKVEQKPQPVPVPQQTMGVVIDAADWDDGSPKPLKNNADEDLKQNGAIAIHDLQYKEQQIEKAKARNNIKILQIPDHIASQKILDGALLKSEIMMAAGDEEEASNTRLDALMQKIKIEHPEFILEYVDPTLEGIVPTGNASNPQESAPQNPDGTSSVVIDDEKVQVIIDKSNVSDISWSEEDMAKIKKARTVELNIKDKGEIEFGTITNITGNAIDKVLSKYQRKNHDIVRALPASKYRATFTGLTFPEVLDLQVSSEMSTFDAEMKKWTIAFNHIKNQSIGPWKEYYEYRDPATGQMIQIGINDSLPTDVPSSQIIKVDQFDDFMRHTSYLDLKYIIWCILCATAMDSEIIQVRCTHQLPSKQECNNIYDWVYKPADLLVSDSISEDILQDIANVSEAADRAESIRLYEESLVANNKNYVKLPSSGFYIFYGHASAYTYMDEIFGRIEDINKRAGEEVRDPGLVSEMTLYVACQIIKFIIIKNDDGTSSKISGVEDIVTVLKTLDEIDWKTINELSSLLITPYSRIRWAIRGLVCNKCHTRSTLPINDMTRLLFIVAQSLQSVQVKLTKD